jgi:NADPH:quinone reductase-like Zn-dependent oxidoreductase
MLEQQNLGLINQFGVKAISQFTQVNKERLPKLAEWVDQNKVNIHIEKTFSLDEAGKALDYLRDIHSRAKSYWQSRRTTPSNP